VVAALGVDIVVVKGDSQPGISTSARSRLGGVALGYVRISALPTIDVSCVLHLYQYIDTL
jgi:hypothetical protein